MARCKTDFLCNLKQVGTQLALILYLPLIFTFCGGGGAGSFGEQEVGGQGYVRKERNGPELGVSQRVGSGRTRENYATMLNILQSK